MRNSQNLIICSRYYKFLLQLQEVISQLLFLILMQKQASIQFWLLDFFICFVFSKAFSIHSPTSSSDRHEKTWPSSHLICGPWQHGTLGSLLPLRVLLYRFPPFPFTPSSCPLEANRSTRSSAPATPFSNQKHWTQQRAECQSKTQAPSTKTPT